MSISPQSGLEFPPFPLWKVGERFNGPVPSTLLWIAMMWTHSIEEEMRFQRFLELLRDLHNRERMPRMRQEFLESLLIDDDCRRIDEWMELKTADSPRVFIDDDVNAV